MGWDDDVPTPQEIRLKENLRRVYDRVTELVGDCRAGRSELTVSTAMLCQLHAIIMAGEPEAGVIRHVDVQVGRPVVLFEPPSWQDVPTHLVTACDYINAALRANTPTHAASYVDVSEMETLVLLFLEQQIASQHGS